MGKLAFLDALKRAMPGLPPATQAKTLAYYEQRFVDGMGVGRSEADIARELGDPSRIAMTLRASVIEPKLANAAPYSAKHPAKHPASGLRVVVSAIALGFFNLFMVAPAAVVGALLLCVYVAALTCYVGGIAITASGLAGANDLVLGAPLRAFGVDPANRTHIIISETGINVGEETMPETAADDRPGDESDNPSDDNAGSSRVVRGAEAFASHGLHITADVDESSRTTQTVLGFGMVLGGIVLFLLGLVASRYTVSGLKRYLHMNLSLLRGS